MSSLRLDYELIDFGQGRKLERFATTCLDRPAVGAIGPMHLGAEVWSRADARYEAPRVGAGSWNPGAELHWQIQADTVSLELRLIDSGQVGVFPEQAPQWDWVRRQLAGLPQARVLNLFGYTGASTLVAAGSGAAVVHLDAAAAAVRQARRNAQLSGLSGHPIRWIVEDAQKFVARELRRGNRYEAVILDPPTYGHGPQGQAWRFENDISPLIESCASLLSDRAGFVLLTSHSPGWRGGELAQLLTQHLPAGDIESGSMELTSTDGRTLDSGAYARWWR